MKMQIHFYSHLVDRMPLRISLEEAELSPIEKEELEVLSQEAVHHAVMHAILLKLSDEDKKIFLKHVLFGDHPATWRFLHKKTRDVESLIQQTAGDLHKQMHEDIQEAKKKTKKF